ncbi:MAG: amidinotransferase [Flexibacter sp. CG_4_10_14_3_um_filter_32_15]|nr:MAG: amidinotransferase [Flexibacter sp. CG_4_10_14_3_um_filter_32_15]
MEVNVNSETGKLNSVLLGIASDRGKDYLNNPKHAEIAAKGEAPTEEQLIKEVEEFNRILVENGVQVVRPRNISEQGQIFCRDIGFSIGNDFFVCKMKKDNRQAEISAIDGLINSFKTVHYPPKDAFIEGGDIIVWKNHVFVGIGDRTNEVGVNFLKSIIGDKKEVIAFPLRVTNEGKSNILHLDCAFQPVGAKFGIIYKEGFKNVPEPIYDIFGEKNLIEVSQQEMYDMFPNIFSINPEKVVIEKSFERLKKELIKRNIETIEINYGQVSKLGGLLRCSTCPINRDDL